MQVLDLHDDVDHEDLHDDVDHAGLDPIDLVAAAVLDNTVAFHQSPFLVVPDRTVPNMVDLDMAAAFPFLAVQDNTVQNRADLDMVAAFPFLVVVECHLAYHLIPFLLDPGIDMAVAFLVVAGIDMVAAFLVGKDFPFLEHSL